MNRSVVTHQSTAWWRSHRATTRCRAGSVLRRWFGRRGKKVASATLLSVTAPWLLVQPDQKAVGQHDDHRVSMKPWPQAALVLVPAHLPLGLFIEQLDRMAPVGRPGQLFQRGLRRQVAPEIFPLLGLPPDGSLPHQPAAVSVPVTGHPPTPHGHKFLAQPPFGASPPANGAPLPAGTLWSHSSARHTGVLAALPLLAWKSVRTATTYRSCRISKPARKFGLSP